MTVETFLVLVGAVVFLVGYALGFLMGRTFRKGLRELDRVERQFDESIRALKRLGGSR